MRYLLIVVFGALLLGLAGCEWAQEYSDNGGHAVNLAPSQYELRDR